MNRFLSVITRPVQALLRLPLKLLAAPRRIWGLSLPTRVAIVVAVIVIAILAVLWVKIDRPSYQSANFWQSFVLALVLTISIPFAVRWAVALWLEGPASRYPEIDRAWNAGLQALAQQNLSPADIPIFLVHGVPDERQATFLFQASQERFLVDGVPSGLAELHWHATSEAIFLVCMCQSQLTALANAMPTVSPEVRPQRNMRDSLRGTIEAMEVQEMLDPTRSPGRRDLDSGATAVNDIRGTLTPGDDSLVDAAGSSTHAVSGRNIRAPELSAKLQYVCQLLRRLRQPACPINGILTVLPVELALDRSIDPSQIQQAMKGDLETIRQSLQLRCPAVTIVTGMESEVGFRELVRRVGHDLAKNRRFGKGFGVWNTPSPEQIEAVAAHACVAFDIWAYKLFREENGLLKPGNPKLYSLICKIRTELHERVENILVGAYGYGTGPGDALDHEPLMFGGCYFASTGERPDLQAFVRGVFDLLIECQDKLQWMRKARLEEASYQRLAHVGFAVDGILLAALVGYALYRLVS